MSSSQVPVHPEAERLLKVLAKKAGPPLTVVNARRLENYFQTATNLKLQCNAYLADGDDELAYIFLLRYTSIFVDTIRKHNGAQLPRYRKQMAETQRSVVRALDMLEDMRKELLDKYTREIMEATKAPKATSSGAPSGAPSAPSAPSAPPLYASGDDDEAEEEDEEEEEQLRYKQQRKWDNLKLPFERDQGASKPVVPKRGKIRMPQHLDPTLRFAALDNVRPLNIPTSLMQKFLEHVRPNTEADCETCAILTGKMAGGELTITTMIFPPQEGTSDTCVTHGEEALFDIQISQDLLTLGWIHTHPSQTCFLSSIDLHTQYSYQVMMPEAVAIVMAPSAIPEEGIFTLTDKGKDILSQCNRSGFHKHTENEGLYGIATHTRLKQDLDCEIIDLRET